MNSDKKWIFIGVVLVFISGVIAGIAVERKFLHCRSDGKGRVRERFSKEQVLDRLTRDLALNKTQRESVGEIFDRHKPEFKALHKQIKNNMSKLLGTIDAEILNVLDEGQKKKYKNIMKKKDKHRHKGGGF